MVTVIRSQWRPYGVAVLTVAIALLLKLLLRALVGSTGLAVFYAAVTISAWYGGLGPGLVATVLSTLALNYLLVAPVDSPAIAGPDQLLRLGAFILVTLLIGSLSAQLRTTNRQLKMSLEQLEASREAQQRSEGELQLITDAVPVLIAYVDSQQYYRFVNKRYEDWFGQSVTQLCGKPVRDVLGEAAYETVRPQIERVLSGEPVTFEREVPYEEGRTRYVSASYVPRFGSQGDVEGFVGLIDITERKRLEDQLRQSEAQFRRLFESNIIGIFFPELKGNISEANNAFLQTVGYTREDLRAGTMDWKAMSPPEYQALDLEKIEELRTLGACTPFEKEYIRKDGSRVPILVGAALLEGSEENTVAFVLDLTERNLLLLREQTARAEAELAKEQASQILESITDGFIAFDQQWCFTYINHEGARTLGRPATQLLGKNLWDEFPELDRTSFGQLYRQAVAEGVPLELEDYYPPFDAWFALRAYPTETGGLSVYFRDISDRVAAEAKIQQLNESLEQRVQERTAQLEAVNQELEAFSYSVSHDLRAPLRHISGFVELLQKQAGTTLDATSQRYVKIIAQTTQQAGILVDNLLAFSRMGRIEMRYTSVKMAQLVKEVQWELEPEASGRLVRWQVAELPPVLGDPSLLRLVLRNLLENALKYTQTRAQAEIEIGSTNHEREVIFFVRDNGVGFDMRYVHKLFGVFQRLHSEQQFEGTGIGLANVRRIIQRHGGRTWAEGVVNGGATFYFSLPLDEKALHD